MIVMTHPIVAVRVNVQLGSCVVWDLSSRMIHVILNTNVQIDVVII